MEILTRKLFTAGCQFQTIDAHSKHPLYVSEENENGSLILIDYTFACDYGKSAWINLSQILWIGPEYFVFQYRIFGELETVKRYYNSFKIVNYKKHNY